MTITKLNISNPLTMQDLEDENTAGGQKLDEEEEETEEEDDEKDEKENEKDSDNEEDYLE